MSIDWSNISASKTPFMGSEYPIVRLQPGSNILRPVGTPIMTYHTWGPIPTPAGTWPSAPQSKHDNIWRKPEDYPGDVKNVKSRVAVNLLNRRSGLRIEAIEVPVKVAKVFLECQQQGKWDKVVFDVHKHYDAANPMNTTYTTTYREDILTGEEQEFVDENMLDLEELFFEKKIATKKERENTQPYAVDKLVISAPMWWEVCKNCDGKGILAIGVCVECRGQGKIAV